MAEFVEETCSCGAKLVYKGDYPSFETRRFREAHEACRERASQPSVVVLGIKPYQPPPGSTARPLPPLPETTC